MTQWDDGQWPGHGSSNPVSIRTGTPEGRFLATSGKPLNRHAGELREQVASALARFTGATSAVQYATHRAQARQAAHRGGSRPWPLRVIIPVAIAAEVLTAFVAMEELVSSVFLAMGVAIMAALVGACIAAMIANRRLNALPVPASARILEGLFVAVLTLLRFESLDVQSGDFGASLGGAALAALISAIALLAIEEVLVETETGGLFASRVRLWWRRWHCTRAASRLTRVQARVEAAGDRFHQHFLGFLVQSEGLGPAEAQRRPRAAHGPVQPGHGVPERCHGQPGRAGQHRGARHRARDHAMKGPLASAAMLTGAALLAVGCTPLTRVISPRVHPPPQPPLAAKWRGNVSQIWTAVIRSSGGWPELIPQPAQGGSVRTSEPVQLIPVPADQPVKLRSPRTPQPPRSFSPASPRFGSSRTARPSWIRPLPGGHSCRSPGGRPPTDPGVPRWRGRPPTWGR